MPQKQAVKRKLDTRNESVLTTKKETGQREDTHSSQKKKKDKNRGKTVKQEESDEENDEGSEEYESDEDLNLLTANDENGDLTSDSDAESSSDEETGPRIKWSNKLKKIGTKTFRGPEPGAIKRPSTNTAQLDQFYEVFPEKIIPVMAKSTNAYIPIYEQARRKKTKSDKWSDEYVREVTTEDMKAYTGIRMIMAVDPKPSLDDYWSANPALGNQKVIQTMSRRRFQSIQRYLHITDPKNDPTRMADKTKAKEILEKNPLYKVSPLMEAVRKKEYGIVQPSSRDSCRRGNVKMPWPTFWNSGAPNKPAKCGFKIFVAADVVSGYLWNFQVYMRKQRVVENLTESVSGRNHIIFIDKFYTSVPLALSLLKR